MKKLFGILVTVVLIAVIGGGAYVYARGGALIKDGVETTGGQALQAPVKLGGVGLNIFAGSAALSDFAIGNPRGFSDVNAFSVGRVALDLKPMSVFSDTVHIELIDIAAPNIVVEPTSRGSTNLQQLQKNLEAYTGPAPAEDPDAPAPDVPDIIVDRFVISGAQLGFVGKDVGLSDQTIKLPTIELNDIGVKEGGVPPKELMRLASDAIMPHVQKALLSAQGKKLLSDVTGGKVDIDKLKDKADSLKDGAKDKVKDAIGGFLKKKKEGGGR